MKIKFKHNGVWVIGQGSDQCVVIPGVNDLPKFEKHLNHPDVQDKIKAGILEIIEEPKAGKKEAAPSPGLAGMKEKEALALVKETVSEPTLLSWKETETRAKILKAIDEQLAKVVPADAAKE